MRVCELIAWLIRLHRLHGGIETFRDAIADALCNAMSGASGAQLAAVVREAGLECLRRHVGTAYAEVGARVRACDVM